MSWLVTTYVLCKNLPSEIINLIVLPIFFEKACILQKYARNMMHSKMERSERIAIRYYETILNNRIEPVVIINGRWRWLFNKNIGYDKRVEHVLDNPIKKLPFKNPSYNTEYKYPRSKKRKLPAINMRLYFMD